MKLHTIISESRESIQKAIIRTEHESNLSSLPSINETFDFFEAALINTPHITIPELPSPPDNLKEIVPGIYRKNDMLICATAVSSHELKYLASFSGSLILQSCVQDQLSGLYLSILVRAANRIHCEPISFGYLLREEFFISTSDAFIVPFLILPSTIPEALDFLWVYLAIRYLAQNLHKGLEYNYLAPHPSEIELLKQCGCYEVDVP